MFNTNKYRGISINEGIGTNNGSAHLSLEKAQASGEMLVGLSFSACVGDIAAGKIPEERVSKIIANTHASTEDEFNQVIKIYREIAWCEFPDQAEDIARRMQTKGLIEQPRVKDKKYIHFTCCGHWIEQKDIDQIQYNNCI